MIKYHFVTSAPCSFVVGSRSFKLAAGQPFSVEKETALQIMSPGFKYSKYVILVHKDPEPKSKATEVQQLNKVLGEPKEEHPKFNSSQSHIEQPKVKAQVEIREAKIEEEKTLPVIEENKVDEEEFITINVDSSLDNELDNIAAELKQVEQTSKPVKKTRKKVD